jgi:NodT family efflux transporter outer membrane factor (OMF) lipoprotein
MYNYKISRGLILFITAIAIGFSSCHTYKDLPEAPPVDAQGILREDSVMKADTSVVNKADTARVDTASIASIPWKGYFTDPKLQALINEGLANNVDMQVAITRITQAEASLSMARGASLPTVAAAAMVDHTRTSANGDILSTATNIASLGFSATWEIDLWGKLSNQSRAKYASYLSSYEYRNLIQTTLISNIAKAYYTLMAADKQLKITKETIALLEKSTETIAALKEAGQQNAAAVEQSRALLYNTQLSVPTLESQIRKQENAICVMVGRKPSAIDRDSLDRQNVTPNLDYGVPAQILARRPDVKQAELSFRAAYSITRAAKANLYPSFTISSARLGVAAGHFSDLFKPEAIAAEIVAGLTQPILNKKQVRGNLKIAQAQQEEALAEFKYTVLAAGQEVSDILFSYNASLSKNEFRDKQIASLTNAVDFTQELLLAGEANYTEVLSAQQSLLSAQLNQVNDKLEQLTYSVSLYKALGGGLQ